MTDKAEIIKRIAEKRPTLKESSLNLYANNIIKLYNDVKSLYVDYTEGAVTASLTLEHEDVNI